MLCLISFMVGMLAAAIVRAPDLIQLALLVQTNGRGWCRRGSDTALGCALGLIFGREAGRVLCASTTIRNPERGGAVGVILHGIALFEQLHTIDLLCRLDLGVRRQVRSHLAVLHHQ